MATQNTQIKKPLPHIPPPPSVYHAVGDLTYLLPTPGTEIGGSQSHDDKRVRIYQKSILHLNLSWFKEPGYIINY
jgi:hypothetical protein